MVVIYQDERWGKRERSPGNGQQTLSTTHTLREQWPNGGSESVLEQVCTGVWQQAYARFRRSGATPEQAQDLTQDFFAHLLRRNAFCRDDLESPRFRCFVRVCLDNFQISQWHRRQAWMRGGKLQVVSWETVTAEDQYAGRACQEQTPETLCYRAWVAGLLERVWAVLRDEYVRGGKGKLFETIEDCLSGTGFAGGLRQMLTVARSIGFHELWLQLCDNQRARLFAEQRLQARALPAVRKD